MTNGPVFCCVPVRILDPTLNNIFTAEVEAVLQVVKGHHQAGSDSGPSVSRR